MGGPKLSRDALSSLEERIRQLEEERIPRLKEERAEDGAADARLRSAREELDRLRETLATATPLEEEPHDPSVVELGDTVSVREKGADDIESFTIVEAVEARLDESRISVESPLARSLLGRRAGDRVEVTTPGGRLDYEVVGIDRRS